jgi:hypothetical protein
MLSTDELYNIIIENYRKLEEIPGDAHALCPKLDDFDITNYDYPDEPGEDATVGEKKQRIKDGEARLNVSYKLGLMLGLNEDQVKSWLDGWKSRVEGCLRKCDQCVRNWHSGREEFLGTLSEYVPPERWKRAFSSLFANRRVPLACSTITFVPSWNRNSMSWTRNALIKHWHWPRTFSGRRAP